MPTRLLVVLLGLAACHVHRREPIGAFVGAAPEVAKPRRETPAPRFYAGDDDDPFRLMMGKRRIVVTDTTCTILDSILFIHKTAEVDPNSTATLDAIVSTLDGNPSIQLIEVQADGDGDAHLGEARAYAILDYLVGHGIDPERLEANGSAWPPAGRSAGTRFLIVKRAAD